MNSEWIAIFTIGLISLVSGLVVGGFIIYLIMNLENKFNKEDYKNRNEWDTKEFFKRGCPFCRTNSFLEGPRGGVCVNIECSECGARFNIKALGIGVDLIDKPKINNKEN